MKSSLKRMSSVGFTIMLSGALVWLSAVNGEEPTTGLKQITELKPLEAPIQLKWAPPELENPITIIIGQGYTSKNLKPDRDYIIQLPEEKQVGGIALKGGRNIVLIGGHITVPPGAINQAQQRAIYIKDATGIVHIEGVNIDNSGGSEFDGIAAAAPQAILQMQNIRITGLTGTQKTLHADIFQPWGGAKEIRIDRLTGTSDYQGFQIPMDAAPIGSAEIRNVNLGYIKPINGGRPGFLLWITRGFSCITYPISFQDVYVEGREGETVGRSVWPPAGVDRPETAACAAVEKDKVVSWPSLPSVKGEVKQGPPPQGDFVPEEIVGIYYISPGYAKQ
jgi:hypothetical protein